MPAPVQLPSVIVGRWKFTVNFQQYIAQRTREARMEFLEGRIRQEVNKINKLKDLPHQHALLLLRFCIQQNLRHLQRSLRSDDLEDLWAKLDTMLWEEVVRMRMRQREDSAEEEALGRSPSKLPARLSGLGLLSFKDVAPSAYRSACESSDQLLGNLGLIPVTEEPPPPITQPTRRAELWDTQLDAILQRLNDIQRKRLIANASKLGRSWLSTIPLFQPLRLSNTDTASALHDRGAFGKG
ncbi:hypothetical protein D1P53_006236 [Cryptococcus gattii VGV]|nr:hypothetical protein D1P53_006236 [Cryptococcus gattii VGV]